MAQSAACAAISASAGRAAKRLAASSIWGKSCMSPAVIRKTISLSLRRLTQSIRAKNEACAGLLGATKSLFGEHRSLPPQIGNHRKLVRLGIVELTSFAFWGIS